MVITSIIQNKNESLVDIYVDGLFIGSVDKNFMVSKKLIKGKNLSASDVDLLKDQTKINKLSNMAKALILARPRSKREIIDYLHRKEKDDRIVASTVEYLEMTEYIDDAEFCKWWIDNRITFKALSKKELEFELQRKGVNRELIKEAMNKDFNIDIEEENILKIADKKYQLIANKSISNDQKQQKLISFLQRKGYNWDLISKVKNKYFNN